MRAVLGDHLAILEEVARASSELLRNSSPLTPRIVFHQEVAPLVFLANDPPYADRWTRRTLGALADGGERVTRLRNALHLWLINGRDTRSVGALLCVHPNTIKYRVGKALELLPKGSDTNHVDVRLALEYWHWTHG